MKVSKLMLAVLAGLAFASCSDDLKNDPVGPDTDTVGSTGYIGISIGMPSEAVTRGLNDQFEDGLASEYEVKSAGLIFFTGSAADPEFYQAYTLNDMDEWDPTTITVPQITQNQVVTFPVDFAKETSEDLWVLAVINYGGLMTISNQDYSITINGIKYGGKPQESEETEETEEIKKFKFSEFLKFTTSEDLNSTTFGFFMTNSPYSSVPGTISGTTLSGTPAFQVLSRVNKSRIFPTKQAAEQEPAAAIFVERAVAKVEVNKSANFGISTGAISFPDVEDVTQMALSVSWVLDNTEPESYIVRNLGWADKNTKTAPNNTTTPYWALYDTNTTLTEWSRLHFRFIGNAEFGHTQWPNTPDPQEHYRTYFCLDPHAEGITGDNNFLQTIKNINPTSENYSGRFKATGSENPQYCKENTFDVAHMNYKNTTRAVIKIVFGDGKTNYYTVGENNKTVYKFSDAASYLAWEVLYNTDVAKVWKDHFSAANPEVEYSYTPTTDDMVYNEANGTATNAWMALTMASDKTTGRLKIKSITLKDGNGGNVNWPIYSETDETEPKITEQGVIDAITEKLTVKFFNGGVAYYALRIKHFGDQLAPWTTAEETTNTTTDSYGKNGGAGDVITDQDEKNYLGRYGVVRNNWYVINLGNINQMGEPVVGDLPLDYKPDDRVVKEESISCRINILSWARRTQTDNL